MFLHDQKIREIRMSLEDFIAEIESAAQKYALKTDIVAKTKNAIKLKLAIGDSITVQCYYNQTLKTTNFVLIGWSRRLYGRDSVGGTWHRHSFESPDAHDTSGDGSHGVTPEQFFLGSVRKPHSGRTDSPSCVIG